MPTYLCKPDELREKAATLEDCVTRLQEISDDLSTTILSVGNDWMGSASATFLNSYNNRRLETNKYLTVINEYANLLKDAASRFEEADRTAAQRISYL